MATYNQRKFYITRTNKCHADNRLIGDEKIAEHLDLAPSSVFFKLLLTHFCNRFQKSTMHAYSSITVISGVLNMVFSQNNA
ncbi:hypothetical protein PanWU01x14_306500 [Parasponia andersonii]|uniref:Uncharacterized protein n=1 Tax=Parasponia andersonii TaxID=3476 RepID=A0A2P5ART3_PARAD|nr:hypothetical protein PanWU01x14_306500 [Parasponia andersonii]